MRIRGFTIVELVVTVAISGILVGMATEIFQEYKVKAYDTTAHVTMRNNHILLEALINDLVENTTDDSQPSRSDAMVGAKYTGVNNSFTNVNHTMYQTIEDVLPVAIKDNPDVWVHISIVHQITNRTTWTMSVGHCGGSILYWWHDSSGGGSFVKTPYYDAPSVNFFKMIRCP